MMKKFAVLIFLCLFVGFFLSCGGGGEVNPAFILVANANDDSISVFQVDLDTGELTHIEDVDLPAYSAPTCLVIHPNEKFLFCANSNSKESSWEEDGTVSVFTIDMETAALTEVNGSPFDAHEMALNAAIHPNGEYLYVVNAMVSLLPFLRSTRCREH